MEEGYIIVSRGGKWGYIDVKGEEVIPCQYDHIYVIDRDGRMVSIRNGEKRGQYDLKTKTEKWF